MRMRTEREVEALRELLRQARTVNSRMVAGAIGAHLSAIRPRCEGDDERLAQASDAVREASFQLLKALHRGKGVKSSRLRALRSVDTLATAIPSPRLSSEPPPLPRPPATWLAARLRLLGRLAPRRFEANAG